MTKKNFKETNKISSTLKPCLRKPDSELLFGDIPNATKQAAGSEGDPAGFLVQVSKSNLNNLERGLKKN